MKTFSSANHASTQLGSISVAARKSAIPSRVRPASHRFSPSSNLAAARSEGGKMCGSGGGELGGVYVEDSFGFCHAAVPDQKFLRRPIGDSNNHESSPTASSLKAALAGGNV